MDGLAPHFHIQGLGPQAAAAASVAGGASAVAGQHVFVLDFVAVALYPFKELVQTTEGFRVFVISPVGPDNVFLLLRELAVRLEDGNAQALGILDKLILEPAHFVSPPAGNGSVINAFGLVRHHQVFADPHNLPQAPTHRTSSQRAVEGEQIFVRLPERNAVFFETGTELEQAGRDRHPRIRGHPRPRKREGPIHRMGGVAKRRFGGDCPFRLFPQGHIAATLVEGGLDGGMEPGTKVFVQRSGGFHTVYEEPETGRVMPVHLQDIFYLISSAFGRGEQAAVTFFLEGKHQFHMVLTRVPA